MAETLGSATKALGGAEALGSWGTVASGVGGLLGGVSSVFGKDDDDSPSPEEVAMAQARANLYLSRNQLADQLWQNRKLAEEQYLWNKQTANDELKRQQINENNFGRGTRYYNTNNPAEAQQMFNQEVYDDTLKRFLVNSGSTNFDYAREMANLALSGNPAQRQQAWNAYNSPDQYRMLAEALNDPRTPRNEDGTPNQEAAIRQAQQEYQNYQNMIALGNAEKRNAMQNYKQPDGTIGAGTYGNYRDQAVALSDKNQADLEKGLAIERGKTI